MVFFHPWEQIFARHAIKILQDRGEPSATVIHPRMSVGLRAGKPERDQCSPECELCIQIHRELGGGGGGGREQLQQIEVCGQISVANAGLRFSLNTVPYCNASQWLSNPNIIVDSERPALNENAPVNLYPLRRAIYKITIYFFLMWRLRKFLSWNCRP